MLDHILIKGIQFALHYYTTHEKVLKYYSSFEKALDYYANHDKALEFYLKQNQVLKYYGETKNQCALDFYIQR